MVHNNYKWNISKKEGISIVNKTIHNILNDSKDDEMNLEELSFALNNRTKDITIENNKKKKNINNFIKNILGGLLVHIQSDSNYEVFINENDEKYIKLLKQPNDGWVVVGDNDN